MGALWMGRRRDVGEEEEEEKVSCVQGGEIM